MCATGFHLVLTVPSAWNASKLGHIVIPTFQGRGQQLREIVELALGHTASMPQSCCPSQVLPTAESIPASSWA